MFVLENYVMCSEQIKISNEIFMPNLKKIGSSTVFSPLFSPFPEGKTLKAEEGSQ